MRLRVQVTGWQPQPQQLMATVAGIPGPIAASGERYAQAGFRRRLETPAQRARDSTGLAAGWLAPDPSARGLSVSDEMGPERRWAVWVHQASGGARGRRGLGYTRRLAAVRSFLVGGEVFLRGEDGLVRDSPAHQYAQRVHGVIQRPHRTRITG